MTTGSRWNRAPPLSPGVGRWPVASDAIYQAADSFLFRLLRDAKHRTLDPSRADFFLVPLERVLVQNTYDVMVSDLIVHWIETWLQKGHKLGPLHKHIWLISTDQCAASGSELAHERIAAWLQRYGGVVLCHYGLPDRVVPLMDGTLANGTFVIMPGAPKNAVSQLVGSDIDPWRQDKLVQQMRLAYGADGTSAAPSARRTARLLFWGTTRFSACLSAFDCRRCIASPRVGSPHCKSVYSRGIRQVMWKLYANDSFCDFRTTEAGLPSLGGALGRGKEEAKQDYMAALLETEYCLAAPGNGFGVRMIDYMASGCIPVIVNNSFWFPFEQPPLVPYADFAHIFPLDHAHEVVATLKAEGDAERARRRQEMRKHVAKFLWDEAHGEAYATTLKALALVRDAQGGNTV